MASFIIAGGLAYGLSFLIGNALGWESAYLLSIVLLMFGGLIRFIGHTIEPIPPMVLDDSDQFVKLTPKTFNWKIVALVFVGYIAEFSSGLPNRLFPVHVNYISQLIFGVKPDKTKPWKEVKQLSDMAFEGGYNKLQQLREYYQLVSQKSVPN